MTNAEIVEKVKKLLALSESPNEQEAATALAKAHALLESHNLSMGDVIYKNANEVARPFLVAREAMPSWIEILINNVADFNYCSFIKMNTEGAPSYILVGKPINVTVASQLIDYLVQTVNRIASNRNETSDAFKFGMVYSILKRLSEIYNPTSESKALVLNTEKENNDLLNSMFNNDIRKDEISPDTSDSGAYFRGWIEGKTVGLHEQVEGEDTTSLLE
jgi:hypothetical protein